MTPVHPTFPTGFSVTRLIGQGAFASVYEGTDPSGKKVAIKILVHDDDVALERFIREIRILQIIPASQYVVGYRGHGNTTDGRAFLAMELVDGYPLSSGLQTGEILDELVACKLMLQLCSALEGLHKLGVAHGDVKPANIMLADSGRTVKLLDFGLVRDAQGLLKLSESDTPATQSTFSKQLDQGVLMGAPDYMAPEQIEDAYQPDRRLWKTDTTADVYSLGLIFYQLLTGHHPFPFRTEGKSPSKYRKDVVAYLENRIQEKPPEFPVPTTVGTELWHIVEKALHHDFKNRYRDARELQRAVLKYMSGGRPPSLDDEEITMPGEHNFEPGVIPPEQSQDSNHKRWLGVAGAAIFALIALYFIYASST